MTLLKLVFLFLGTISLMLGIVGIVVPGLPTTPFLLLTAALYMRGSKRVYKLLIENKYLGPYILNYKKYRGIPLAGKIQALVLQWIMITVSCIWGVQNNTIRLIIILSGLIGSFFLIFVIQTVSIKK